MLSNCEEILKIYIPLLLKQEYAELELIVSVFFACGLRPKT